MGTHATTHDSDRKIAISKLEPNPTKNKSAKPKGPVAESAPVIEEHQVKPRRRRKVEPRKANQYLDLGAGYRIAHKVGSGYSTLYRVIAERGHFAEVASLIGKTNLKDPIEATKLLEKLMVPIDKLEEICRNDPIWQEHARKKTDALQARAKDGDETAKAVLMNQGRCAENYWSGNFAEMLSTCVGYYNWLVSKKKKPKKPNKNVDKFPEAKIVFRRYPLKKGGDQKIFAMMFPEQFVPQIKQAILSAYGVDEDKEDED